MRNLRIAPCRRTRPRPFREAPRPETAGGQMKTWVALNSTSKRTRVVVTLGDAVVLRASLPPLATVRHTTAVTALLEALSLWTDERLCVALFADDVGSCFRCALTDELGLGARSVYYAVELVKREPRRRRSRPAGKVGEAQQLVLVAPLDGAR